MPGILIALFVCVWFFLVVSACIYSHRQRRGVYSPLVEPDLSNVFPLRSRVLTIPSGRGGIVPSDERVHLSDEGHRFMEGLMQIASAGITFGSSSQLIERERWMPDMQAMLAQGMRNDEPVDIDYEQPQTMYPELPEMKDVMYE